MLDRSIPYCNVIMKCTRWDKTSVQVKDGYSIRSYQPGDEATWARLEHGIGDFDSYEEALSYFTRTYLQGDSRELERIFFALETASGQVCGSVASWRDLRNGQPISSLHWLIVDPSHQGNGLGKALLQTAMNWYLEAGELPVYLHTQPWSFRAIRLYAGQSFRMQKTDTFSHYENHYSQAMETLQGLLPQEAYQRLLQQSED